MHNALRRSLLEIHTFHRLMIYRQSPDNKRAKIQNRTMLGKSLTRRLSRTPSLAGNRSGFVYSSRWVISNSDMLTTSWAENKLNWICFLYGRETTDAVKDYVVFRQTFCVDSWIGQSLSWWPKTSQINCCAIRQIPLRKVDSALTRSFSQLCHGLRMIGMPEALGQEYLINDNLT
jgi:hypothetical protein